MDLRVWVVPIFMQGIWWDKDSFSKVVDEVYGRISDQHDPEGFRLLSRKLWNYSISHRKEEDMIMRVTDAAREAVADEEVPEGEYLLNRIRAEGRVEGRVEGRAEGRKELLNAAKNMKENGLDLDFISRMLGIPVLEIKKL